jgi:hypothetical protein
MAEQPPYEGDYPGDVPYVESILCSKTILPASKSGRLLLDYCVVPRDPDGDFSTEMVELLLKYGVMQKQKKTHRNLHTV